MILSLLIRIQKETLFLLSPVRSAVTLVYIWSCLNIVTSHICFEFHNFRHQSSLCPQKPALRIHFGVLVASGTYFHDDLPQHSLYSTCVCDCWNVFERQKTDRKSPPISPICFACSLLLLVSTYLVSNQTNLSAFSLTYLLYFSIFKH